MLRGKAVTNIFYGITTKKKSLVVYCKISGVEVLQCGLIVHERIPWICCSPERTVLKNGQLDRVLEIKHPILFKEKPFIDPVDGKVMLKYLKYNLLGHLILNPSSIYYTQCQILMMCTGLQKRNLFIDNNIKPVVLSIEQNDNFLNNISKKIEIFYFNYLPYLVI